MVRHLNGVVVSNSLKHDISNFKIIYAESNKASDASYLYDYRTVDVERHKNVLWEKCVEISSEIPAKERRSSNKFINFGNNRGYWQVYFKCGGSSYKLDKHNAMMNLSDKDNGKVLTVAIIEEENKIRLNFEVPSGKCHFFATEGAPLANGITVELCNRLEEEISKMWVVFAESSKSRGLSYVYNFSVVDVETGANVNKLETVEFKALTIPAGEAVKSKEKLIFEYNRHYWQVYFTYKGRCYKIDKNNAMFNLEEKDNGGKLKITLRAKRNKVLLDFETETDSDTFHAIAFK